MKEIILFDIPLYKMCEKEYQEKYDKFIYKKACDDYVVHGIDINLAIDKTRAFYHPKQNWRYNQIIGYIQIYYKNGTIYFDSCLPNINRFKFNSNKKHYLYYCMIGGYHFNIKNLTNQGIGNKIKNYLESIKKEIYKGKYFFDYSTFNNVYFNIDYLSVFNKRMS